MSAPQAPKKVLVVDDDPVALFITRSHLSRVGYEVSCVDSVANARALFKNGAYKDYFAVVSDYRMPKEDGLVMLQYARECDPTLAVIMATAEGEKNLVAHSLRGGAVDFLDKPFSGHELIAAVKHAVEITSSQRLQSSAVKEVSQIAQSQRMLLGQSTSMLGSRFKVFFRPHEQAGGDFVAAFPLSPTHFVVLVSDVSGHDMQAAYRSAYLQGFARAMLSKGTSIETTFAEINLLLMQEWNSNDDEILSLAACAACVDTESRTLKVLNCGLPAPYLVDHDGWARALTDSIASPLGWFADLPESKTTSFTDDRLMFWSDGLDDLAERINCDPLALACRLHTSKEPLDALFSVASDDIICVQIDLDPSPTTQAPGNIPVFAQKYPGSDRHQIDDIQNYLEKSLNIALPDISSQSLHDCVISTREALLNALTHGCSNSSREFATLQINYNTPHNNLWVRVADEGKGHSFDFLKHEEIAANELIPEHHGLLMIKYLSKSLSISSSGNCLTMEFSLDT